MGTDFNRSSHPSKTIAEVLVLYTGGTIGMVLDPKAGLVPAKNLLKKLCQSDQSLNDEKFRQHLIRAKKLEKSFLVLPPTKTLGERARRVAYEFHEYDDLIDSSNMSVNYWQKICGDIRDNYYKYDGFVILHGTDTMAYTASALSFMLRNLNKSVVLTGAQKPIFDTRTDGRNNFVSSILIAGLEVVPEVTIFFFDRLIRGNRSIKRSADDFFGFDSCNVPPIMTFGVRIDKNGCNVVRKSAGKFHAYLLMNDNVSTLRIFPGISTHAIQAALGPPYEGIVLHTYGAGNIPSDRGDLIEAIKSAIGRGAIVVNCTQCPYGEVAGIYATGMILTELGVISGNDMTLEAAIAKLMFVLSMKRRTVQFKKKLMTRVLRGEMTVSDFERRRLRIKRAKINDTSNNDLPIKMNSESNEEKPGNQESSRIPEERSTSSLDSFPSFSTDGELSSSDISKLEAKCEATCAEANQTVEINTKLKNDKIVERSKENDVK